ncbi:MAG: T9SS type A sorting domain-containing protein [Bacteroidales bacterium]|nr:T9SS type A sorting domain-containing protein [Bacteroidales bacterium]
MNMKKLGLVIFSIIIGFISFSQDEMNISSADSRINNYLQNPQNPLNEIIVGTGTEIVDWPYFTMYTDSKCDILYTASEINNAGGFPGNITIVGLNVHYRSSNWPTMNGFQIKMQHTTLTNLTSLVMTGWTTVYAQTYTVPGTGWQYITLTTPFNWNGTNNLLVEICFDNPNGYWGTSNTVKGSITSDLMVYHKYIDNGAGCDLTNSQGYTHNSYYRPNISLNIAPTNPPVAPTLISPPNNSTGISVTPTLDWNDVSTASSYRVQVSVSSSFSSTIVDVSNLTTSSYTIPGGILSYGALYYWRVNATNSIDTSPWSAIWNFTTIQQYLITTSSNPTSGGTTTGGGTYLAGQSATVIATPYIGWSFDNWKENGNIVSDSSSYTFIVTSNRTLEANFSQQTFQITTSSNPTSGGTTSGGGTYTYGQTATVIATSNTGWNFDNWKENGNVVSTDSSYSFTVTSNRTLEANFSQQTFQITTSSNPTSGGATSGGGTYTYGQTATVIATSNTGWNFDNWKENGNIVSDSLSYTFIVTSNRTLVANFSQIPYQITTTPVPDSGGSTSGGGTYYYGQIDTVVATPNTGWDFVNWTENGIVVSTYPTYSFPVTSNRYLDANFTQTGTFLIQTSSYPAPGGSTSGGGTYIYGYTATVVATSNPNWQFVNWTENGTIVSISTSYSFTVTSNRSLVANFEYTLPPEPFNLLYPPDQSTSIPLSFNFLWENSLGATYYHFLLSDDSNFIHLIVDTFGLVSPQYFIQSGILVPFQTYFWKVRSYNNIGYTFSATFSFTTNDATGFPPLNEIPITVYPNPSNGNFKVKVEISSTEHLYIGLFDVFGRLYKVFCNNSFDPGIYEANIIESKLKPGVYLLKISFGLSTKVYRIIILNN